MDYQALAQLLERYDISSSYDDDRMIYKQEKINHA